MKDPIIDMIMKLADLDTDNQMYKNGVMRLGAFIEALKKCKPDSRIQFDFCGFVPTRLDSYRGFYAHLAFGFEQDGKIEVAEVLADCEQAIGKTYEGYKGGDFTMNVDTPLWVDNYSESNSTAVVGLKDEDYYVVIQTAHITI